MSGFDDRLPQIAVPNQASPVTTVLADAIDNRLFSPLTSDAAQVIMRDLLWKFTRGDWHGVSDAANDLRVLEAEQARR